MASLLRSSLVLLSFLMVASAQEKECQVVDTSAQEPLEFTDPHHLSLSLQIYPDVGDGEWVAMFRLGQKLGGTFEASHEMEIKRFAKAKNKRFFWVKLFVAGRRLQSLVFERLSIDWLGNDSKIDFGLVPSGVKVEFSKGDTQLVLQVSDDEVRYKTIELTTCEFQAIRKLEP